MLTAYASHSDLDSDAQDSQVRVCYRINPLTQGRVFVANSSKCVDAEVIGMTRRSIEFLTNTHIAVATPVRIEIGRSGPAPLIDMAAEVVSSARVEGGTWYGTWRHACKWARPLTAEQLIAQLQLMMTNDVI